MEFLQALTGSLFWATALSVVLYAASFLAIGADIPEIGAAEARGSRS